jgi:transglutaminase-like putative cysteine protease
MTIFSVEHTTRYSYRNPIVPGIHRLMFRPRDSFDQRLLASNLVVLPTPVDIRWTHDAFGNCITHVEFDAPTTSMSFETRLLIDHRPEDSPDFSIEEYARNHPFDYSEEELPDLAPYMRRHHAEDDCVEQWLATFMHANARTPTGQLLMTLNEAIRDGFAYNRRTVLGTRTPGETIARREGTCRDFALLMMEGARQLGFAARFVTGYVYVPDRDQTSRLGGGSTHAWCQIYLPGSGWAEFDPTNGIVGNRDLIRVGVARTPLQATPLSGYYYGNTNDEIGMNVSVQVRADPPTTSFSQE